MVNKFEKIQINKNVPTHFNSIDNTVAYEFDLKVKWQFSRIFTFNSYVSLEAKLEPTKKQTMPINAIETKTEIEQMSKWTP